MVEVRREDLKDIPIPSLNWPDDTIAFTFSYDRRRDIQFVRRWPKRPAISLDVGGHLWIRFDPESGEVLGVEIEDFERVFLVNYPHLRVGWESIRPRITKRFRGYQNAVSDYLRILVPFVKDFLRAHPHQRSFAQN